MRGARGRGQRVAGVARLVGRRVGGMVVLGTGLALSQAAPAEERADNRAATLALLAAEGPHATPSADETQARDALERATRMRNAGDEGHARLAEGLALEWASLARDSSRTTRVEAESRASEVAAVDARAHAERERALLEEAIARSGRLRAELAAATVASTGGANKTKERTSTATGNDVIAKPKAARAVKGAARVAADGRVTPAPKGEPGTGSSAAPATTGQAAP